MHWQAFVLFGEIAPLSLVVSRLFISHHDLQKWREPNQKEAPPKWQTKTNAKAKCLTPRFPVLPLFSQWGSTPSQDRKVHSSTADGIFERWQDLSNSALLAYHRGDLADVVYADDTLLLGTFDCNLQEFLSEVANAVPYGTSTAAGTMSSFNFDSRARTHRAKTGHRLLGSFSHS